METAARSGVYVALNSIAPDFHYDTNLIMVVSLKLGARVEERDGTRERSMKRRLYRQFPIFDENAFRMIVEASPDEPAVRLARRRLLVHSVVTYEQSFEELRLEDLLEEHKALREIAFGGYEANRLWARSSELIDTYYAFLRS